MQLKYLGHASFLIKSKDAKLITDPYDPKMIGAKYPKQDADIVTVSHQHGDHNYTAGVSQEALVIDWPGEFEKNGMRIFGYKTYHDKEKGKERGENTIYKIEADDIAILHLGDLGHVPDDDLLDEIGDIDILLVPVGGHYTIDAADAIEVIKKVEPSIAIPMHYNRPDLNQKVFSEVAPLDTFLKKYGAENVETLDQLSIKKEDLSEETKLVVLKVS